MDVYVKVSNNEYYQEFILPESNDDNCQYWAHFKVDLIKQTFEIKKLNQLNISKNEWERKKNATYPSKLFDEFLRMDYEM